MKYTSDDILFIKSKRITVITLKIESRLFIFIHVVE